MSKINNRITTPFYKKIVMVLLSIIILAIQIAIIYFIFYSVYHIEWVYYILEVIGLLAVFLLVLSNENSSYKIIWSILILTVPFAGTVFYLTVKQSRRLPARKAKKINRYLYNKIPSNTYIDELKDNSPIGYKLSSILNSSTGYPLYKNTNLKYYSNIQAKAKDMIEDIYKAEKYILLEYFIVASGTLLTEIIKALENRGNAGVEIKFLFDDIGSRAVLKRKTLNRLKNIPNLSIAPYEPLGFNYNPAINYRDHRKLTIIDGKTAYIGGDNIGDEYVHLKTRFGVFRDTALRLTGEAVDSYILLFAEMWYMSTRHELNIEEYLYKHPMYIEQGYVFPFGDGPTNKTNPCYELFMSMFMQATKYIYISTPYFIIDDQMINALILAIKGGVDVKILVPHIPDKKSVFLITREHYRKIIEAGGSVYEYTPGFNHAKGIIVDDKVSYLGTFNLDYRSMFLHYELGALIISNDVILDMKNDFLCAIINSELITIETWKKRNWFLKLLGYILSFFAPLF